MQSEPNLIIYVGDSSDVLKRIRTEHCHGNIEASALRRHIAEAMGYKLKSEKRLSSKSQRTRIDLPNPKEGENQVSAYIQSGQWRYVLCESSQEAKDFQWYAIAQLKPVLNKESKPWNPAKQSQYQTLLNQTIHSVARPCSQLTGLASGPGVYILYHYHEPLKMDQN